MSQPKNKRASSLRVSLLANLVTAVIVLVGFSSLPAVANQPPRTNSQQSANSSMCVLPLVRGADGQQYIVTRAGYQINIPGLGVAADAKQIQLYTDGQKHFWYVDRAGHAVKMTDQQVEWGRSQVNLQAQSAQKQATTLSGRTAIDQSMPGQGESLAVIPSAVPGSAPTVIVQPTTVVQSDPQPQGSISATSGLVNGLVAAGGAAAGAAAGAAMTNSMYRNNYYGIPYGTPVYHNGSRYYYNGDRGNRVYVAPNSHYTNQWAHQTQYRDDRRDYRKDRYNDLNKNQQQVLKNQAYLNTKARRQTANVRVRRGGGSVRAGRFR